MNFRRRAQSGLEYLVSYGWVFIVIIIIAFLFWQTNPIDRFFPHPRTAKGFTHFEIIDFGFSNNISSPSANRFYIDFQSLDLSKIMVDKLELYRGTQLCGVTNYPMSVKTQKNSLLMAGVLDTACSEKDGGSYNYEVRIYFLAASQLSKVDVGELGGPYEDLGPIAIVPFDNVTNYDWRITNYSGNPLNNENGWQIGSYQGVCPAVPPNMSGAPQPSTDYITWSQPGNCSNTSQLTGVGFSTAVCNLNATYLSHGWLSAQVYVGKAYADHTLFLGGQAWYVDGNNVNHTNYICVNDNFYFYVNGQMIFRGGTTGLLGSEVIRNCSGYSCNDSDGWCIPPVEASSGGAFQYGANNTISILLEDYCTSGGIRIPHMFFA